MQERRERHSAPQHDTSGHDAPQTPLNTAMDPAGHGAPQRAVPGPKHRDERGETEAATSRYVQLLERDNEFLREQVSKKDEQISDLSTRFSETQTLLGAMQRMFAPLLGQADPFKSPPESREVTTPLS